MFCSFVHSFCFLTQGLDVQIPLLLPFFKNTFHIIYILHIKFELKYIVFAFHLSTLMNDHEYECLSSHVRTQISLPPNFKYSPVQHRRICEDEVCHFNFNYSVTKYRNVSFTVSTVTQKPVFTIRFLFFCLCLSCNP